MIFQDRLNQLNPTFAYIISTRVAIVSTRIIFKYFVFKLSQTFKVEKLGENRNLISNRCHLLNFQYFFIILVGTITKGIQIKNLITFSVSDHENQPNHGHSDPLFFLHHYFKTVTAFDFNFFSIDKISKDSSNINNHVAIN